MIAKIYQIGRGINPRWTASKDGTCICSVESTVSNSETHIKFEHLSGTRRELYFSAVKGTYGTSLKDRFSYHILKGKDLVGYMRGATKGRWFKGYLYYEINYHGEHYQAYEVGMGRNGLYLCIYKNDSLVAMVSKALIVENDMDSYKLYTDHEEYLEMLIMITVYYDALNYESTYDYSMASRALELKYTRNKELLEKYDPQYIQKISNMESGGTEND